MLRWLLRCCFRNCCHALCSTSIDSYILLGIPGYLILIVTWGVGYCTVLPPVSSLPGSLYYPDAIELMNNRPEYVISRLMPPEKMGSNSTWFSCRLLYGVACMLSLLCLCWLRWISLPSPLSKILCCVLHKGVPRNSAKQCRTQDCWYMPSRIQESGYWVYGFLGGQFYWVGPYKWF